MAYSRPLLSPSSKDAAAAAGAQDAGASFLDAVGQSILASAGSLEAHIDAEGLVKRLVAEEKPSSRAGKNALVGLKDLAKRAPAAVVATQGAVPAILRAVAKLSPPDRNSDAEEDFDAVEPLQDALETLSILVGDASADPAADRRGSEVAELVVRHTEKGKGILQLISARDMSTKYDAMVLMQRTYRRLPSPLEEALLADPQSIGQLMNILQTCFVDYVRNEALGLLILFTQSNKELQKIMTVQGLVETLFAILAEEDLAVGGKVARDLLTCLMNLVDNVTCQKYIRETDGLGLLVAAMSRAVTGKRPNEGADEDEDDDLGISDKHRADIPAEARWACLSALVDAALALVGRRENGAAGDGSEAPSPELGANQDALIRAGALSLCKHLREPQVALPAKLRIVALLDALANSRLAAKRLQAFQGDSVPLLHTAADVVMGISTDLKLRNALGRVVGRAVAHHADLQSFFCSSLSPQLHEEEPSSTAEARVAPAGRQIVGLLEDAAAGRGEPVRLWFALHFVMAMLHGNADVQSVCVSMPIAVPTDAGPPMTFLDLVLKVFSACARACQGAQSEEVGTEGAPSGPEPLAAALVGVLKLLSYWFASCPPALAAFACSPVTVPRAMELATAGRSCGGAFFQVHVEGLACILLGLCVSAEEGADVDVAAMMALIAERVGIEEFQQKVERLRRCEPLQRPPRGISDFRWYGSRFRAFIRESQRSAQRRMVQLYVAGNVGLGGGGAALSEDVADHYKQLIRVQDSELREVRKENEHLRSEVEAFMRRALQAKSAVLVEKMTALEHENEALHSEVAQLTREAEEREVRFDSEREQLRSGVLDLEQQLQSMAVGYEQVERSSEALARDNAGLRAQLAAASSSARAGASSDTQVAELHRESAEAKRRADEFRGERDDLLELLGRVVAMCPEAARLVAPIGKAVVPNAATSVGARNNGSVASVDAGLSAHLLSAAA